MKGIVKAFNTVKGYGFITSNKLDQEVFVHQKDINMDGFRKLTKGQKVKFECIETEKGLQARNVFVIK